MKKSIVIVTERGNIIRFPLEELKKQHRGG